MWFPPPPSGSRAVGRPAARCAGSALPRAVLVALLATATWACHATPGEPQADATVPVAAEEDDLTDDDGTAPVLDPAPMSASTYDGSGELVHPDASVFPKAWRGTRFWFAATPYPSGNPTFENPSIYTGRQLREWQAPAGLANPLARPESSGYLSDPDLSYDPARDELRLYYRQTVREVDQIYLETSPDGTRWSSPTLVLESTRYDLISPAVVRESDGSWRMWTVGAHAGGCRAGASGIVLGVRSSSDGIAWGKPHPVQLAIPGRVPWHWDVQYVRARQEYWALVAAYPDGGTCSTTAVFFARSPDGIAWAVSPAPLLAPGELDALRDVVYRSTFRYFPKRDLVAVWFSGARLEGGSYHYAVATARYSLPDLLRRVQGGARTDVGRRPSTGIDRRISAADSSAREAFVRGFP
jgi:hypothetical protein